MQVPDAWPNIFRQSRFLSAVDFVQADRFRRKVAQEMARVFSEVDLLLVPSLRDEMLVITNFTGHPSLTLRAGFVEVAEARSDWAPDPQHPLPKFSPPRRVPHGVTLIGRLFDEGTLAEAGMAMEARVRRCRGTRARILDESLQSFHLTRARKTFPCRSQTGSGAGALRIGWRELRRRKIWLDVSRIKQSACRAVKNRKRARLAGAATGWREINLRRRASQCQSLAGA